MLSLYEIEKSRSPVALLKAAFDTIEPRDNWKNPISAFISRTAFDITAEACVYYTGSVLYLDTAFVGPRHPNEIAVKAAGYYMAVGA